MMVLSVAVAVTGALCVFVLVLNLGMIRRMREQSEQLADLRKTAGPPHRDGLGRGALAGDFTATATSGAVVSRDGAVVPRLAGFFSPGCQPCEEQLPGFIEYAATFGGEVLSVVAADGKETPDAHVRRLEAVGEVVVATSGDPLHSAFRVGGYPALYVLDPDGRVISEGASIASLRGGLTAPSPV